MIRRLPIVTIVTCVMILGLAVNGCAQSTPSFNYQVPSQSDLNEYQAAVKANPNDYVAHTKLGNWYLHAGKPNAAIKEYKKAIKLSETYATAWNNLGSAYHAKRKYKDAAKYYRKAVELQPDMAAAHRNLGTALLAMSRVDEGVAAFRRALELNPAILDAMPDVTVAATGTNALTQYYYFAKICAGAGRIDAAIEFLKRAQDAGFADFQKVRHDPDFKAVVADARFERIVHSSGN